VALLVVALAPTATVSAGGDLLPDLEMAPMYGIDVQVARNGRKRLRFGTVVYNVGTGPLEVRAANREGNVLTDVKQRIYSDWTSSPPVYRDEAKTVRISYEDDGHRHFHIRRFIVAQLFKKTGGEPRLLRKIGFCLVDTIPRSPEVPGKPDRVSYTGCGYPAAQSIRTGISVGWGDVYSPYTRYQQIDITNLTRGIYRLCSTVNPEGIWSEGGLTTDNNTYWFDLDLRPRAATVTPLDQGMGACEA
jgi:hypothetical protein